MLDHFQKRLDVERLRLYPDAPLRASPPHYLARPSPVQHLAQRQADDTELLKAV